MHSLYLYRLNNFNPRAHTGRDSQSFCVKTLLRISIHAPTRGTTHICTCCLKLMLKFQSTRPHGARLYLPTRWAIQRDFNPRAHTGRDHRAILSTKGGDYFNPRAHTGRDIFFILLLLLIGNFNPRAHTGRDGSCNLHAKARPISIHAPTRGATHFQLRRATR